MGRRKWAKKAIRYDLSGARSPIPARRHPGNHTKTTHTNNSMAFKYRPGNPTASNFSVAPGKYQVRVIDAKEETSKSGNDMIKLHLRTLKEDGTEGPALFDYLVMSETAQWKIDQFLSACETHPGEGVAMELDADAMVGWECEAELSVETYEGKKQNKVVAYVVPEF